MLALESELQRLSLQREREEGNKALRDLYDVGVAGPPSSEAEQLLQLKTGKEELMAEVDRLKAANAVLTDHLRVKAEELLKKDLQYAAREQQVLQARARAAILRPSVCERTRVSVCARKCVCCVRMHIFSASESPLTYCSCACVRARVFRRVRGSAIGQDPASGG